MQSRFNLTEFTRKTIKGTFSENELDNSEETFEVIVCGTAEESYKASIDFFNATLHPYEKERHYVSAQWVELTEKEKHVRDCLVCADRSVLGDDQ